jgi:hypothetical protein
VEFEVIPYSRRTRRDFAGASQCFLVTDNWDDYSYKTSFLLIYFGGDGVRHDIGSVKIMTRAMSGGYTQIESEFTELGDQYASIGQDQEYYENLMAIDEGDRIEIFEALRDVIWDEEIFSAFRDDDAFQTSLLRSVHARELRKLSTIVHQQAALTPFHFRYHFSAPSDAFVEFEVIPNATPPTNIHAVVGRNGIGKTTLLRSISTLLQEGRRASLGRVVFFADDDEHGENEGFANLVTVAFSAFDEFDPPSVNEGTRSGIQHA